MLLLVNELFKTTSTARIQNSIYKYKSKTGKSETHQ
jgi:hypothetical protein